MQGKIAIVDYGVGNLFSLRCSLQALGLEAEVSGEAQALREAGRIILPGVGAFADAMAKLQASGLCETLAAEVKKGKPLLGICLGMQLLFEESHEFGRHRGLGFVPGQVRSLAEDLRGAGFGYKVPHIGWNPLRLRQPGCPLLKNTEEGQAVYFVHSYYLPGEAAQVAASSEYGVQVAAAVQQDNVFGTQFHPEKSGAVGLAILRAFAEVA